MAHTPALRARQDIPQVREGAQIVEQSRRLDGRHLHLLVQVPEQEGDPRPDAAITDLLEGDQAFVEHLGVFRADRFQQVGDGRLGAQDAGRARGVGP